MPAQRNDTLTLGAIIIVALAIIGLSVFIGMQLAPRPEATVVREVVTATARPGPPIPSTPRPIPTASAQDNAAYVAQIAPPMREITTGLAEISRLFESPRFSDSSWTLQVAGSLAMIRLGHDGVVAATPASSLTHHHQQLKEATGYCSEATYVFADGIDARDARKIDEATALLEQCALRATSLMRELSE